MGEPGVFEGRNRETGAGTNIRKLWRLPWNNTLPCRFHATGKFKVCGAHEGDEEEELYRGG